MRTWFYEQMAMYSAYHRDHRNQATHHIGVPLIVFSLMILTARVPLIPSANGTFTLAAVLILALVAFYMVAVPMVGTVAAFFYGGLLLIAEALAQLPIEVSVYLFLGAFIGGWIIQFVGHAYEGRRPALFDNLLQIFMAPSFLIAEILFHFGIESRLEGEIAQRMHRYLPDERVAVASEDHQPETSV